MANAVKELTSKNKPRDNILISTLGIVALVAWSWLVLSACGTGAIEDDLYQSPNWLEDEKTLLKRKGFATGQVGYVLYDPQNDKVIMAHNPSQTFLPASVNKIVTAYAALKILGPDFRFQTELFIDGKIENQELDGRIILRGTGNPLLRSADLYSFIIALKERGIKKINGPLVYDQSDLPVLSQISENFDENESYNSGVSALSLNHNRMQVTWRKKGNRTEAFTIPQLPHVEVQMVKQVLKGGKIQYTEKGSDEIWLLSKDIERSGYENLPVKNPGLYAAHTFKLMLEMNGILVMKGVLEGKVNKKSAEQIYQQNSPPLLDLMEEMLLSSNNVSAELATLKTAQKLAGKKLNAAKSAEAVLQWLEKEVSGLNRRRLIASNGSGLSDESQFAPMQMVKVLNHLLREEFKKRHFPSFLPLAGISGTLKARMLNPDLSQRVWAKTGSLFYVSTLAGYLHSRNQKLLSFTIFLEDKSQRDKFTKGNQTISSEDRLKAAQWKSRAHALQDALLQKWILEN